MIYEKSTTFTDLFSINNGKLIAHYGTMHIEGQRPYFSVTGELYERTNPKGRFPSEPVACGIIHDEIAELFPELKPLINLHLSDLDGIPMYAHENGWYWYAFKDTDSSSLPAYYRGLTPAQRAAAYLHCDPEIFNGVTNQDEFNTVLDNLKPIWKNQAEAIIKQFELE